MTHKQLIVEYEAGATSLVMSFIYRLFPQLFIRKCERKWKRYQQFNKMYNQLKKGIL